MISVHCWNSATKTAISDKRGRRVTFSSHCCNEIQLWLNFVAAMTHYLKNNCHVVSAPAKNTNTKRTICQFSEHLVTYVPSQSYVRANTRLWNCSGQGSAKRSPLAQPQTQGNLSPEFLRFCIVPLAPQSTQQLSSS